MVEVGVHRQHRFQPVHPDAGQAPVDARQRRRDATQATAARLGREKKPSVISADEPSSISSVVTPAHVTVSGSPVRGGHVEVARVVPQVGPARFERASDERFQFDAVGHQAVPYRGGDLHRTRRITMHANGFHRDRDR